MTTELATVSPTGGSLATLQKGFDFVPQTFAEAKEIAGFLSSSDLLPKEFRDKPANVLIAIAMGTDLGIRPMQALQNIAVINGKPSMYGDLLLAVVRASAVFESISETTRRDEIPEGNYTGNEKPHPLDGVTAVCTMKRRGEDPIARTFSVRDARRAGLWGKSGPWSTYPRRMLQMRARGFCMRDGFADVLKGMTTREEAQDITDANAIPGEYREAPANDAAAVIDQINARITTEPPPEPPLTADTVNDTTGPTTIDHDPQPEKAEYKGPSADELIEMIGNAGDADELNHCEAIANEMPGGPDRDRVLDALRAVEASLYKKASGG